jgi:pimeloyl-ACP methyl ester carboxylesterase
VEFVLVHGAYHGSWCWDLVQTELVSRGHRVVTMDLPIGDPNSDLYAYRDTVLEAASGLEAPVVVGHSMAGAVIPLVAESRPVSSLVFLSGFLPSPGTSLNELRAAEPLEKYRLSTVEFEDLGDQVWMVGTATARELFFHDVPKDLARWAEKLLRPQCYRVFDEASPLRAWPDVRSAYILCTEDRALNPDWSRSAAQHRLGVTPIELRGGHSPFLSRPAQLAAALLAAA